MPISSYAIRCDTAQRDAVISRLATLPGVTIGDPTPDGIPIVAEAEDSRAARALGEQLEQVAGIESAVLVYHNFEDEPVNAPGDSAPRQPS